MKADDVYAILNKRIKNGGATDEQIQNAVNQFLIENPVQVGIKVSDTEPTEESVEVWINPNDEEEYQIPEINDDEESEVDTWSSKKINEEHEKLIKYVTPEMFGASGDGISNDTEALKQCLLQDKSILLSGNYKVTEDLYITKRNTHIFGKCGNYSSTSPTIYFDNCSLKCNIAMSGLRMEHVALRSEQCCLILNSEYRMGDFSFFDVWFIGNKCIDIDCETGYIYFTECHFATFATGSETKECLIKLAYSGVGNNKINYIYFDRCSLEGGSIPDKYETGILVILDNCSNINFTNCDICNCNSFIEIENNYGASQYIKIENNYIWNIGHIINLTSVLSPIVNGNIVYNRSGEPIIMPGVFRNAIVSNNNFTYWTKPTIGSVCGNIFKGNTISIKSASLEIFAPRDDLINCERTHILTIPANDTIELILRLDISYVDDYFLIFDNNEVTYTRQISGKNFIATIKNTTDKEISIIARVV